ncbi:cadherin-23-like isoform X2 [Lineus longissimus]|uniref:cadherin-23-like isoform X2 n=1 Tax=Lineus longissimus TaxID=88925 RepID=UPI00315DFC3C
MAGGVFAWISVFRASVVLVLHGAEGSLSWSAPLNVVGNYVINNIKEDAPPANPIITVKATSNHPKNPIVYYRLSVLAEDGNFQIYPTTGVIEHIPSPNFDYENPALPTANGVTAVGQYVMTVTAFTGLAGETITKTIHYNLENVNEAPYITNLPKCVNLYETDGGNHSVWTIDARDPDGLTAPNDWGSNKIKYVIEPTSFEPASGATHFEINQIQPGYQDYKDLWRRKTSINYETQNNYNMTLYVEDRLGVKPNLRDRNHRVHVQVIDVNEAPEFQSAELKTTCEVAENTPIGTTVSTGISPFRAYEKDKYPGPDCPGLYPDSVTYFVEGKYSEYFRMDTVNLTTKTSALQQDGYLIVDKLIDREDLHNPKEGTFILYVNARDTRGIRQIKSQTVEVTCSILDQDDHPTYCQDYKYETTLPENTAVDSSVAAFTCTDEDDLVVNPTTYAIKDVGNDANATLANQYFDVSSNVMRTKQKLNLEGGTVLSFKVLVSQGSAFSQLTTTLTMEVTILGQNDHRPVMSKDFYNFFVAYNVPDQFVIGTIFAIDADQPASVLTYFLLEKDEGIMLGTRSGKLYTDYTNIDDKKLKKNAKYWMSTRANDNDSPSYYSNHVYIRVNTYDKKDVMVNIEVAMEFEGFTETQVADFEKSISNICQPCKGICPEKSAKGSKTT